MHASGGTPRKIFVGIDVGSTTVKAVVIDPDSGETLWDDYRRHHTKQPETVLEFLVEIAAAFPEVKQEDIRLFVTGSGAAPLAEPLGAKFVQEVNAVTLAVEHLHPKVHAVVELGGQDAKIIIFRENEATGEKSVITSMNDKCASGTGATIDKCMIKAGVSADECATLRFDAEKLHHVAAKCGVFAETDIVNLVKTGIPANEIMCSLADAIVMQNLSVLTRGHTLKPTVLLLGGPNTYLPFLQECWRKRIPELWEERGLELPEGSLEELILVPKKAQLYAAIGAVRFGMHEAPEVGVYRGLDGLKAYCTEGRKARLGETAGPPLMADQSEKEEFTREYGLKAFEAKKLESGSTLRAVIGLDGGSTSSKAVLLDESGEVVRKAYALSKGNPIRDMKELLATLKESVERDGATLEVLGFGATGYAADVLEECLLADVNVVETVAHMMSATHYFGDVDVICDIGGQDIKVLFMEGGHIKSFKLSNQCSAGNGMLLQAMADQFGVPVTDYAETAFAAELAPTFSYGCAVFLDTDRVNFQKEGYAKEELLAGLAQVLPKNVWQYVVGVPRLAALGKRFVLQGGTQYNLAAVKAQVDYLKQRVPGAEIFVHPHTGEAGAIGAAMETLRVVGRRGHSTFVGLEAAIALEYESRNDASTVCHFCANECSRTFIDARRPDGSTSRSISGFSCEKGMVESKEAMQALMVERKAIAKEHPNLVTYEGRRAFSRFAHDPLPAAGAPITDVKVERGFFGGIKRTPISRGFRRASSASLARRKKLTIAIPRVLNLYSTAPFFRTYLESLGVDRRGIVFSDHSSEEMFAEGGKYGSVDPCYPSKVVQAHIHQLLFHAHEKHPLDAIFFPAITHVESYVKNAVDHATCPIVAGTPNVIKAAFTKEKDYFAERGIQYLDPALSFVEPTLLKRRMYESLHALLECTEDESDFAVEQGLAALSAFDQEMQDQGRAILETVERENRMALLMVGRPYHLDPGLHHGIPDEFQLLGYPILTARSLPRDEARLQQLFGEDLRSGLISDPLEINDVWPENYSANSAQKVFAVKYAARHPNIAILDLSSFKCGHDAPIYGLIDSMVKESGVPHAALHDVDANKPGGSIKIRVKTYSHTLQRREEELADLAKARDELERRVAEKRERLLRARGLSHAAHDAAEASRSAAEKSPTARALDDTAPPPRSQEQSSGAYESHEPPLVPLGRRGSAPRAAAKL